MKDPRDIISALRDGHPVEAQALGQFIDQIGQGAFTDAQIASFAMAVLLRPLSPALRTALTCAMRDSGRVLEWGAGPVVADKHSTGGVGDATSFIVAPILAACGLRVPMISGRGLGHTGGTLDKLEAITGLNVDQTAEVFQDQVNDIGLAIVSASADMAPADKRLYRIRDETACVPSIDLITSSILSKKLAEGAQSLVLDVKLGAASFLTDAAAARDLAEAMVSTAQEAGVRCHAVISDMSQPLASAIGHRVELEAALRVLHAQDLTSRLAQLSVALAARALILSDLAHDPEQADQMARRAITSGAAAQRFNQAVIAQGGGDVLSQFERSCPSAPIQDAVYAKHGGYVAAVDPLALAEIVAGLGGAKMHRKDQIDLTVGLSDLPSVGDRLETGRVIARIHARGPIDADLIHAVERAITLSDQPVTPPPLIFQEVS